MLSKKKKTIFQKRGSNVMNNKMMNRLMVVFTMLFVVMGLTAGPPTSSAIAAASVEEIQTYGATYGEWSARWWQWALSIPAAINPILDPVGDNCAQGQYDNVWFLAGTFGGLVERNCTIPAGKALFFPVINSVAFKPAGFETLLDLRRLAADTIDAVTNLSCSIDGEPVSVNLFNFRVKSPVFTVIAPPNGLVPPGFLSVPGNTDSAVSDGYWLLISPLTQGDHTIHFHAETEDGFEQDVTYFLSIE